MLGSREGGIEKVDALNYYVSVIMATKLTNLDFEFLYLKRGEGIMRVMF